MAQVRQNKSVSGVSINSDQYKLMVIVGVVLVAVLLVIIAALLSKINSSNNSVVYTEPLPIVNAVLQSSIVSTFDKSAATTYCVATVQKEIDSGKTVTLDKGVPLCVQVQECLSEYNGDTTMENWCTNRIGFTKRYDAATDGDSLTTFIEKSYLEACDKYKYLEGDVMCAKLKGEKVYVVGQGSN